MSDSPRTEPLTVEVWSDVACPFCFIGKRRFLKALENFADRDRVNVVWKSFQLTPDLETDPSVSINDFLAREKGIDVQRAKLMNDHLVEVGREEGLELNFDGVVVANTFKAHRFLHFAKSHGRQTEAAEALFNAYFTEGRNVDDDETIVDVARRLGFDEPVVRQFLADGSFADDVTADVYEAYDLDIRGVPFFVLDRKWAVSGAQSTGLFAKALEQAWSGASASGCCGGGGCGSGEGGGCGSHGESGGGCGSGSCGCG